MIYVLMRASASRGGGGRVPMNVRGRGILSSGALVSSGAEMDYHHSNIDDRFDVLLVLLLTRVQLLSFCRRDAEHGRVELGQVSVLEKVAMLGDHCAVLPMRAVICIHVIPVVWRRRASVAFVDEKFVEGLFVTDPAGQSHPHATNGNWSWRFVVFMPCVILDMTIGIPIGVAISVVDMTVGISVRESTDMSIRVSVCGPVDMAIALSIELRGSQAPV